MQDLLSSFSPMQIITFTILLALAIKGLVDFAGWANEKMHGHVEKENELKDTKEELVEMIKADREEIEHLCCTQEGHIKKMNEIIDMLDMLIDSDRDAIKSFITMQHHHFVYEKKWIDDYSMDCLEKRYQHYEDEGGNSYVEQLMGELRNLPKKELNYADADEE